MSRYHPFPCLYSQDTLRTLRNSVSPCYSGFHPTFLPSLSRTSRLGFHPKLDVSTTGPAVRLCFKWRPANQSASRAQNLQLLRTNVRPNHVDARSHSRSSRELLEGPDESLIDGRGSLSPYRQLACAQSSRRKRLSTQGTCRSRTNHMRHVIHRVTVRSFTEEAAFSRKKPQQQDRSEFRRLETS